MTGYDLFSFTNQQQVISILKSITLIISSN
jgi:hypothetical protein